MNNEECVIMAAALCTTLTDRAGVSDFFSPFFFLLNIIASHIASHCYALVGDCEFLAGARDLLAALGNMQRGSVEAICFFSCLFHRVRECLCRG